MVKPQVTIVVVPHERFSCTRASLESIYQNTDRAFSLIYVDGNSPDRVREYLQRKAHEYNFQLIRTEHYLSPNQARNIGLARVDTKYTVFIDNDVTVEPGWLNKLIDCAEETDATVVCPVVCIEKEFGTQVYLAGGEARIYLEVGKESAERKVREKYYFKNLPLAEIPLRLKRQECKLAKFHALLVRTDIFDSIGQLDEKLLGDREHLDFCLTVINAGKTIYCEPDSLVTYVPPQNLTLADLSYFQLRWSDAWERSSQKYFRKKWNLTENRYLEQYERHLGHRQQILLRPLIKQLSFGGYTTWLEKVLVVGERKFNRYISDRFSVMGNVTTEGGVPFTLATDATEFMSISSRQ